MPQLVKGGKHVFGWAKVKSDGTIKIPLDAIEEYGLKPNSRIYLISGSKKSGGFGVTCRELIKNSPIGMQIHSNSEFWNFKFPEGEVLMINKKNYCWTTLRDDFTFILPHVTLQKYEIGLKDKLLVVRGSGFAIGFIYKGPIYEKALKHPELELFE